MPAILGIESSCDETAAALVADDGTLLSSVVTSQIDLHAPFGGVVPEVAYRAHDRHLLPVVQEALSQAGIQDPARELAGLAVTVRPGLVGALLVGLAAAKTLAWLWRIPLLAVDHLAGHIHAARMPVGDRLDTAPAEPLPERFVALVVSGGHTLLLHSDSPLQTTLLGSTQDDAAGEAFDKVATLLGLAYPGGPSIQRAAEAGNRRAYDFPRSLLSPKESLDFSFSGLKTAVLYQVRGQDARGEMPASLPHAQIADLAASFQEAVADVLVKKTMRACAQTGVRACAAVGGVAANARLRERLMEEGRKRGIRVVIPPLRLCTDNAAFIAAMGWEHLRAGNIAPPSVEATPRSELPHAG